MVKLERERQRQRQTERQRERQRQTDRQRQRQTDRQTDRVSIYPKAMMIPRQEQQTETRLVRF